ncbi:MAG: acetyl-CoA carboxylase carboxyl transferase subunit beta [Treponema sp.]|jgi:acetyl-CoA carboxylase carboxyl transferase subunit beta|nr:acetyl-CoA carboxylase carboxyl transferase subunit beta [Treponema sp.]
MADYICSQCQKPIPDPDKNLWVCDACGNHSRLSWQQRLSVTADQGSFNEFDSGMKSCNPIDYPDYEKKVNELMKSCETGEAVVTGRCTIKGYSCVVGIMDSRFMMASMGSVVGEKITRAFEYATANKLPVIVFSASGGARMQEGIISLMQMAKTSGAVARHTRESQLYISVITDPTTGGVTASFATLGDIILAEPGVTLGFAGKRVIQDTIGAVLPDRFQTSEFVYEHGFVDAISHRRDMPEMIAKIIRLHGYKGGK